MQKMTIVYGKNSSVLSDNQSSIIDFNSSSDDIFRLVAEKESGNLIISNIDELCDIAPMLNEFSLEFPVKIVFPVFYKKEPTDNGWCLSVNQEWFKHLDFDAQQLTQSLNEHLRKMEDVFSHAENKFISSNELTLIAWREIKPNVYKNIFFEVELIIEE